MDKNINFNPLPTDVKDFEEYEKSLSETRKKFKKLASGVDGLFSDSFDLYCELLGIVGPWIKASDPERYAIEVSAIIFRRTMACYSLLENGFPQEVLIVIRNALEFIAILIEIIHNQESFSKWKSSISDDLKNFSGTNPFKMRDLTIRIEKNKKKLYPEDESKIASHMYETWKEISNMMVHARTYAQVAPLLDGKGHFQLLGLKESTAYENDFRGLAVVVINTISILMAVPKFHTNLVNSESDSIRSFLERYSRLHSLLSTPD